MVRIAGRPCQRPRRPWAGSCGDGVDHNGANSFSSGRCLNLLQKPGGACATVALSDTRVSKTAKVQQLRVQRKFFMVSPVTVIEMLFAHFDQIMNDIKRSELNGWTLF